MALTLDGFLPHEDEMLMRWVRENKRYGFPRWQRQATFHIYPHYGLMDLLNVKEKHDKDCIYLAGVGDGGSAEYADGLFRYNLVDETVLFLLPLSYGGGIPLTGEFRSARWKLLGCKTFSGPETCKIKQTVFRIKSGGLSAKIQRGYCDGNPRQIFS